MNDEIYILSKKEIKEIEDVMQVTCGNGKWQILGTITFKELKAIAKECEYECDCNQCFLSSGCLAILELYSLDATKPEQHEDIIRMHKKSKQGKSNG